MRFPRPLLAPLSCFLAVGSGGCGCNALLDAGGNLQPDAVDVTDTADVQADWDGPDTGIDAEDGDALPDAGDADGPDSTDAETGDTPDEESGCTSSTECDDDEPCNGDETCGVDGACHEGTPLDDGTSCTPPTGGDGICNGGFCSPPGCGDGILTPPEECEDDDVIVDDGCDPYCMFSCHSDASCADSNVCTDDSCVVGGDGQICRHDPNTAPCDDGEDCTQLDACDGSGSCAGANYVCSPGPCESDSLCDGEGGCTPVFEPGGVTCNDLDPCTRNDVCDGWGGCGGTAYSCVPGMCEVSSTCDGTGGCLIEYEPTTTTCDDSNPCTHTDFCHAFGVCSGTSYVCSASICQDSSTCDGEGGCTIDYSTGGDSCSDGNPCSFGETCNGTGLCNGGTTYTCTPGTCETSSACNGTGGCIPTFAPASTGCNDYNQCTAGDHCSGTSSVCLGTPYTCTPGPCEANSECNGSGGCTVTYKAAGSACNDGEECTHTDLCDSSHLCLGTPYTCMPGQCQLTSTCDGDGGCDVTNAAPGVTCADGYACTHGDACDASGNCTGTPDDSACGSGQLCRPQCFTATGCGLPPSSVTVSCPATTTLPADAACTIGLGGLTGQASCLSCTTEVGMVVLSSDDFTDAGGTCAFEGWALNSGSTCFGTVNNCVLDSPVQACCSTATGIPTSLNGDCMLRTQRNTNCGGMEEWQVGKTYDTRGLASVEVCFRVADNQATSDEAILLFASDATHVAQLACLSGPPVVSPTTPVDDVEWPYCYALPSWAAGNAAVTLTFVAHSETNNDILYIDDVDVRGWSSACTPARLTVFAEDFDPCPSTNPIPTGWGGWTVTGGPICEDACSGGGGGGARASNGTWTMTHTVDTRAVDGDVMLCFDAGDSASDYNETMSVQFNADDGAGWQNAWYWKEDWGTNGSCRRVCFHLSTIDPDVEANDNLQIRFTLASNQTGEVVGIDDVTVDGAVFCPGAGSASILNLRETGGGNYAFGMRDDPGTPLAAYATCAWDSPPIPVTDMDGTWFRY